MNNQPKIEAFKSFYEQAKDLYKKEDYMGSKRVFLKAASIANEISLEANSYNVKMEYHSLAEKILSFVKCDFEKKKVKVTEQENNIDEKFSFKEEYIDEKSKVTFADVAGLQEVKDEITYSVIEPLKNPELANKYKIKPGAKILLYGPPGTGKTYIARAIAGEVDAAFYSINCQDLISKYMGESSRLIDKLFEDTQNNKRAIIFFDEFDSIASKREDGGSSVDGEMARFVSTFLTKVDGFKKNDNCEMLLLIAATNRPWAIDSAMLRGGRFDTHIYVGLPDFDAIEFIVRKEFDGIPLDKSINLNVISNKLKGYGCADIISICKKIKKEAYKKAVISNTICNINMSDIDEAFLKIGKNIDKEEINKFLSFHISHKY